MEGFKKHCLVCYTSVLPFVENSNQPRLISQQLQTFFILRKLFKFPLKSLESYLAKEGNPAEWIDLCSVCTESVNIARKLYEELLVISQKFRDIRNEIVFVAKSSISNPSKLDDSKTARRMSTRRTANLAKKGDCIPDECRRYISTLELEDLTNPFIDGDKEAKKLAREISPVPPPLDDCDSDSETEIKHEIERNSYNSDPEYCPSDHLPSSDDDEDENPAMDFSNKIIECEEKENVMLGNTDTKFYENTEHLPEQSGSLGDLSKQCYLCHKEFEGSTIREHLRECHSVCDPEVPSKIIFPCTIEGCGMVINDEMDLQSHLIRHATGHLFNCDRCDRKLYSRQSLKRHQELLHGIPYMKQDLRNRKSPKTCSHCGKNFSTNMVLKRHISWKHGIGDFQKLPCNVEGCGKIFRLKRELEYHMTKHAKQPQFKCDQDQCRQKFYFPHSLRNHKQKIHGLQIVPYAIRRRRCLPKPVTTKEKFAQLTCHMCDTKFPRRSLLKRHLSWKHNIGTYMKHSCPVEGCTKEFRSKIGLDNHMAHHSGDPQFNCEKCGKLFYSLLQLKNHSRTHRKANSLTSNEPKALHYRCKPCGRKYRDESALSRHQLACTPIEKKHACTFKSCQKAFKFRSELKKHLNRHLNGPQYECDQCGKMFYYKHSLGRHKMTHDGSEDMPRSQPEPFMCKTHGKMCHPGESATDGKECKKVYGAGEFYCHICGEKFRTKIGFSKHIRFLHELKYQITCHICGKGMRADSQLQRHLMISHKIGTYGQKKCTIDGCSRVFNSKQGLVEHLARHSNKPAFVCHCGKTFYAKKRLQMHAKQHVLSDPKPFKCDVCGRGFARKDYLPCHKRTHSKEKKPDDAQ